MKLIIAGGRKFTNDLITTTGVQAFLKAHGMDTVVPESVSVVVSGAALGGDACGERYAAARGIPIQRHKPDWAKHGKGAGFIRNCEMGKAADGLVAFWDGASAGTKHMIDYMSALGKPLCIVRYIEVEGSILLGIRHQLRNFEWLKGDIKTFEFSNREAVGVTPVGGRA